MSHRFLLLLGALAVMVWTSVSVAAQAPAAATKAATAKTWTLPRTPWGDPDLQGYWNNLTFTPLERPVELGLKEFFTEKETAEVFKKDIQQSYEFTFGHPAEYPTYNANIYAQNAWQNGVKPSRRTSVIKDPPNGRMPPLTPEAAARKQQADRAAGKPKGAAGGTDGPEDLEFGVRCVFQANAGPPMLPTSGYNSNHLIAQGPGYVMIEYEWGSGVQLIPLDGRPQLSQNIHRWHGDSRGHWEGNTLVVETGGFRPVGTAQAADQNLADVTVPLTQSATSSRLTERFTRVDADTVRYEFTVADPTRTGPWTGEESLNRNEGPMLEYACAEGNNGLVNILEGARAEEKAAEQAAKKGSN